MKLRHVLPPLTLWDKSSWQLTLLLLFGQITLALALLGQQFSQDWQTRLPERYTIIIPLAAEQSLATFAIRQRLIEQSQQYPAIERFTVLEEQEIREILSDEIATIPADHDYILPIIAYIRGDAPVVAELISDLRALHPDLEYDDQGDQIDSLRQLAEFISTLSLALLMLVGSGLLLLILLQVAQVVARKQLVIERMFNLGTARNQILTIIARSNIRQISICIILSGSIFAGLLAVLANKYSAIILAGSGEQIVRLLITGLPVSYVLLLALIWAISWYLTSRYLDRISYHNG